LCPIPFPKTPSQRYCHLRSGDKVIGSITAISISGGYVQFIESFLIYYPVTFMNHPALEVEEQDERSIVLEEISNFPAPLSLKNLQFL
jgi:hypothetical protein